jgi:hypothetical protein
MRVCVRLCACADMHACTRLSLSLSVTVARTSQGPLLGRGQRGCATVLIEGLGGSRPQRRIPHTLHRAYTSTHKHKRTYTYIHRSAKIGSTDAAVRACACVYCVCAYQRARAPWPLHGRSPWHDNRPA